jgi:hypothetical protein
VRFKIASLAPRKSRRVSPQSGSSWRTIIPSAITRAWETKFHSPHPSRPYPITPFNPDSASAEYSATIIGPQPDESRFVFWTIRAVGIGRPQAWGLAAFSQPGVEAILGIYAREHRVIMR